MGRFPFVVLTKEYLKWREKRLKENSFKEERKELVFLGKLFQSLKSAGKVSTANPAKLTEDDIRAFVSWTSAEGWVGSTFERYRNSLEGLCNFAGNPIFEQMENHGFEFPKRGKKAIKSLTEKEVSYAIEKANEIPGWYGEVARFFVALYAYSGLRPSELRLTALEDLDLINWQVFVRHPKGEGKYGEQRLAPVGRPAREAVLRFLKKREERLRGRGLIDAEPLIPAMYNGQVKYYSEARFRDICKEVNDRLKADPKTRGISFSLKTLRASYCQMVIDRDPSKLSQVSATMGHSTTRTTEEFYGRIRRGSAVREINELFEKEPEIPGSQIEKPKPKIQSARIESRYEMTGYL